MLFAFPGFGATAKAGKLRPEMLSKTSRRAREGGKEGGCQVRFRNGLCILSFACESECVCEGVRECVYKCDTTVLCSLLVHYSLDNH
jgi:hypothetical protein